MSRKNAFQGIQYRKPSKFCSPPDYSSLPACSSTRMRPSTMPYHTQDDVDVLDPLDDISLDIDLDQRSASSATLLSRRVSSLSTIQFSDNDVASEFSPSTRLSESNSSRFLYPLHEPGQRTAQRIQRLRARTSAVIMSMPATCEDVIDVDQDEPSKPTNVPPVAHASKLRRIPGIRDLRRAFRDADVAPAHSEPILSLEPSKASYELGILITPTPQSSSLSPRSSLRTLVDVENALSHNPGDVKTLYEGSTLRSISIASRLATKLYTTFSPSRTPQTLITDTSQSIKYPVHNLSTTQTRRHTSLNLDTRLSRSPGERVWSCAKISQSATKRAARRGTPRRVFSHSMDDPAP